MKKIDIRIGLLYLILAIYTFLFNAVIKVYFNDLTIKVINPLFWLILLIIIYFINTKSKEKIYDQINKLQTIFIIITIYLIIYFLTGLYIGYGKNPLYLNLLLFLKNIWYFIIPIIGQEYIRNTLLKNVRDNKIFIIITIIIFIFIDIDVYSLINKSSNNIMIFKNLFSILIPVIVSNILFTYLSLTTGFLGTLLYRLPLGIINISLPILPNTNWFYNSLSGIILPFIVFIFIKKINDKKIRRVRTLHKKKYIVNYLIMIATLIIFTLFIGGFFKYKPVSIMSNSMYPLIKKGDIVMIEKITDKNILKEGDIVAYILNNSIIVHRIYFVEKHNNGNTLYIMKGDNNDTVDNLKVKNDQIEGIIRFFIPKLGYPSVWLNEYLKS